MDCKVEIIPRLLHFRQPENEIEIVPRLLHFRQPAGTSRGIYTTRKVWYLHFTSPDFPGRVGIGECAPLPALSCDDLPDYEVILAKACRRLEERQGRLDDRLFV